MGKYIELTERTDHLTLVKKKEISGIQETHFGCRIHMKRQSMDYYDVIESYDTIKKLFKKPIKVNL